MEWGENEQVIKRERKKNGEIASVYVCICVLWNCIHEFHKFGKDKVAAHFRIVCSLSTGFHSVCTMYQCTTIFYVIKKLSPYAF